MQDRCCAVMLGDPEVYPAIPRGACGLGHGTRMMHRRYVLKPLYDSFDSYYM